MSPARTPLRSPQQQLGDSIDQQRQELEAQAAQYQAQMPGPGRTPPMQGMPGPYAPPGAYEQIPEQYMQQMQQGQYMQPGQYMQQGQQMHPGHYMDPGQYMQPGQDYQPQ